MPRASGMKIEMMREASETNWGFMSTGFTSQLLSVMFTPSNEHVQHFHAQDDTGKLRRGAVSYFQDFVDSDVFPKK